MRTSFAFSLVALLGLTSLGGSPAEQPSRPAFLDRPTPWADSVFNTLSVEERIGQLMMVAAYSNKGPEHVRTIEDMVQRYNIGGLIFFQGGPVRQAILTNRYQTQAKTPLLIGMDLEWGLAMRLDSTIKFPKQMTLGALGEDDAIERMGGEIARQMRRIGVQMSFSPDADVNSNSANPVINERSFGERRDLVARKSIAYMHGLQRGGVLATAKHFPGHGDTDQDSHKTLPMVKGSRDHLDSLELFPFKRLIKAGISAVMVAHLDVPALDSTPGLPSTLSRPIVTDLLKDELGFKGLVVTDALNMKGVANAAKPGEIELRALLAGNDILLFPQDPVKAIKVIRAAVDSGLISIETIDAKCLKVLRAKEWAGLDAFVPIATKNLIEELNTPLALALQQQLYAEALTVVRNEGVLPIRGLDSLRIASLVIGDSLRNPFQRGLERYARITEFRCNKILSPDSSAALLKRLKEFDVVIASVHNTSTRADKEFGVPQLSLDLLRRLADQQPMVFVLFANPYRLALAYGAQRWNGLVVAYEETPITQDLAAQLLFGALPAQGRLPVTASSFFKSGDGIMMPATNRLEYILPEQDSIATGDLLRMDSIVGEGLTAKAYPGCAVLVAHDGKVIWDKAYGSPTYDGTRPVNIDDIYDLASISKVMGTTLAIMKLVDEDSLDVEKTLGDYLPETMAGHPYHASLRISEILTHEAGLKPFSPFQKRLEENGRFKTGVVAKTPDVTHEMRVADSIYIASSYRDSMIVWVLETPLGTRGEYVYSDLGMYLLMRVVEKVSGMPFDRFLEQTYYAPLGLSTMGYCPRDRFPLDRIMPTARETGFRDQQIQGDVHDPGAALMGGVAGHAGLFSDTNDLAILMQMLLNGGTYGGTRYLKKATVERFTKGYFYSGNKGPGQVNRRGLGWDKPQQRGKPGPASTDVSYASFGHTGFTGTMVWADPKDNSIFVFLSNRVYPDDSVNKLASMDIRTRLQSVVHRSIAATRR